MVRKKGSGDETEIMYDGTNADSRKCTQNTRNTLRLSLPASNELGTTYLQHGPGGADAECLQGIGQSDAHGGRVRRKPCVPHTYIRSVARELCSSTGLSLKS